jgi:hypothetical protein
MPPWRCGCDPAAPGRPSRVSGHALTDALGLLSAAAAQPN